MNISMITQVNTEVLITGLRNARGNKSPPAVAYLTMQLN